MLSDTVMIEIRLGKYLHAQKDELTKVMANQRTLMRRIEEEMIMIKNPRYLEVYEWKKRQLFVEMQNTMKLYEAVVDSLLRNRFDLRRKMNDYELPSVQSAQILEHLTLTA